MKQKAIPAITAADPDLCAFEGRVRLIQLRQAREIRGNLVEIDHAALPFAPRRSFVIDSVPDGISRGGHAHRYCEQLLICLQGRLTVDLRFNEHCRAIVLNDVRTGLYIGPMVWARQTYAGDTRLLVLASRPFEPQSYITDPGRACAD